MPELARQSAINPEFARVIEVARLRDLAEFGFDIAPEPAEALALARLLDAQAVRKLRLRGRLAQAPDGGWLLEAVLGATVIQTCVVSLDPVTTRVDQPVDRRFLPRAKAGVVVDPEAADDVEPLGDRIDLGRVAVEALALALPDYPRKPGAKLARATVSPAGAQPLGEAGIRPFAALAALRDKLGGGS